MRSWCYKLFISHSVKMLLKLLKVIKIWLREWQILEYFWWLNARHFFLGVFAKLQKVTVSYGVSVCLSVRPSVRLHGAMLLPLDLFLWNFILEDFLKICLENSSFIKIYKKKIRNNTTLHEDMNSYDDISPNSSENEKSDERCGEDQNTFYVQ